MVNPAGREPEGDAGQPPAGPGRRVVAGATFEARRRGRIVFGLFIIAVGVFALLDNLDLFDSRLVRPFWPLVLVALGALRLVRRPVVAPAGAVWGLGLVGLGVGMTLNNLGVVHFTVRDWWPLLLMLAGVAVVARGLGGDDGWGGRHGGRGGGGLPRDEHGAFVRASAVMSGLVLRNDAPAFQGGDIDVVMGSVELDLRQAGLPEGGQARLHLSVVMGSVEVRVPRDWAVQIEGMPALGGLEDKTVPPMTPGRRLLITGSVVMGGVEIVN